MPNLTDAEYETLHHCVTPEARTAQLLEWVLIELRSPRVGLCPQCGRTSDQPGLCKACAAFYAGKSRATADRPRVPLKPGDDVEEVEEFIKNPPTPVEDTDEKLPPAKRGPGRPRKVTL